MTMTTTAAAAVRAPQQGILGRPPEHLLLASFTLGPDRSPEASRQTLDRLRLLIKRELRSDLDDQDATTPKTAPSPETGELGFEDRYDRQFLTVTLGLGAGGFDALGTASEARPQDLRPIPWADLGDQPTVTTDNGDLVLQICSDDPYVAEHVVRRVEEELGDRLRIAWVLRGEQRYTTREGRVSRREARALIGFLDGTANLDPKESAADRVLVFVDPDAVSQYPKIPPSGTNTGYGPQNQPIFPGDLRPPPTTEPAWTRGGTYMVVRASVHRIREWDHANLGDQEGTVGRFKWSGASLDLTDDRERLHETPNFATHPEDERVAVNAHVRKVNPRGPEDGPRQIFRRGYPLIDPAPGELQRGLVFVCFARTISTQFEFMVRGWINNPNFPRPGAGIDRLRELFESRVLCGGYFFVPALEHPNLPWSWIVP
jgi:deferrochelatase/peroxidase EfeB